MPASMAPFFRNRLRPGLFSIAILLLRAGSVDDQNSRSTATLGRAGFAIFANSVVSCAAYKPAQPRVALLLKPTPRRPPIENWRARPLHRYLALRHFPRPKIPVLREFLIAGFRLMRLFRGEGFDLSVARLEMHFRVDLQIHAAADGMHDAVSHGDAAVPAHEGARLVAQSLGEGLAFGCVVDEHIGHAERFANV